MRTIEVPDIPAHVLPATIGGRAVIERFVTTRFPGMVVDGIKRNGRTGSWTLILTEAAAPDALRRATVFATDAKATDGQKLRAFIQSQGKEMIGFSPAEGVAHIGTPDPFSVSVRDRLAAQLRVDPWTLRVECLWDRSLSEPRLDEVRIDGLPRLAETADKSRETITNAAFFAVPGFTVGWDVRLAPTGGRARLMWGLPAVLPGLVPLGDLLSDSVRPDEWAHISLGVGPDGQSVGVDLELGPHALYVGPTGSGKTVCINAHLASALLHGHEIAILDPIKGVDFMPLRPFSTFFAETLAETSEALQRIYAEKERRTAVLKSMAAVKWSDLSPEIRRAERIKPITVVADELAGLLQQDVVPKGGDKSNPFVKMSEEANAHKAMILGLLQKLAAEARFVGIHLVLGTQRMDSEIGAGATRLRSNMTSRVQLVKPGSAPDRATLGMTFTATDVESAFETIALLDDGKARGLGVIAAEGGGVTGMRVAFAKANELPEMLRARGVKDATPWPAYRPNENISCPSDVVPEDLSLLSWDTADSPVSLWD